MPVYNTSSDFTVMRKAMIDSQLRPNAVEEKWILDAMTQIKREDFVPDEYRNTAYMDRSIPLGDGRYLAPALTSALMLQKADIQNDDTILYIGGNSGYNTMIAASRGASVVSLNASSIDNKAKGDNIIHVQAQLNKGVAKHAPYSIVMIEGTVEIIPQNIIDQIKEGGRLLCGIAEGDVSHLSIGYKSGDSLALVAFMECELEKLTGQAAIGFEKEREFSF